ncbi:DNA-binding transcriptional regulator, XRE-family HTH domain [Caminicella sporogenes DSM 14501]|uniref:DNA-binding transcriptional regulator, XRE-family HTH domain n=1 Tax=Caminicella sporogenes DSM 14501 TaxID=1121266 RepID=A0A1M6N035_9FIRM|nr:helix-turn-helix transcriptional regulator [Caminicella sporogenes]RKD22420.1 hypothetical protein BET04_05150 [Caminicella sporogenes]SHJ89030.1 DNA-binding transcriptional regulator, XRE-family HTH domain [Caminicella sporogenes DSM 14501]
MNINLKTLRLAGKISIKDMAKLLNISPITYSRKENGKYPFTQYEINKIIDFFEKPYEKIFNTQRHETKQEDINKLA